MDPGKPGGTVNRPAVNAEFWGFFCGHLPIPHILCPFVVQNTSCGMKHLFA
jgi:hypothetical protein